MICRAVKNFETSYVVKLHQFYEMSAPQPCFEFIHPNWPTHGQPIDNTRYKSFKFEVSESATLTGFAGYFDSQLYSDVYLSIYPQTHSPGMFSWFPIYFPLRTPIYVPGKSTLEIQFWRCVSASKVWYEWCVSGPIPSPVHNPNGRSSHIGT